MLFHHMLNMLYKIKLYSTAFLCYNFILAVLIDECVWHYTSKLSVLQVFMAIETQ